MDSQQETRQAIADLIQRRKEIDAEIARLDSIAWVCRNCQKPTGAGHRRVYCSDTCKHEFERNQRHAESNQKYNTCPTCETELSDRRPRQQYCQPACRQAAYRWRNNRSVPR